MSVHGTAHWGNRADLKAAGLTGRKSGLMIGWWVDGKNPDDPVRYDGDLHQLIVGGVGGGKFTTAIAPMLFGSGLEQDTVVVIDPKGEIAQATGTFFQEAFAEKPSVFVLDPWDEAGTGATSVLNFVSLLDESNPNSVDDARALADAMILSSGAENTHWDNAARNFLASVLLYVALDPAEEGQRDLIRVREIVTLPFAMPNAYQGPRQDTLSELLFANLDSTLAGGAVRRGFRALLNREERELSGIISSVERDTAWIDSPQMARVLRGDSLDMKAAALDGGKYYIVIPPDFFMTHRYWLRLCVTAFAKAFRRYRPNTPRGASRRWRHIVIDEFANLGEMNFILTDIAVSRGYDVKYHLVIQDLGQLARVYQQGWESFINNSFQRFFAVSDLFTANYVSGLLGVTTVEGTSSSEGESGSDGSSHTETDGYSEGANVATGMGHNSESFGKSTSVARGWTQSKGWSRGQTFTQVQRPLRTPDEVRRLDDGLQYVLIRGQLPTILWRPVYWELFPSLPDFTLKEVMETIGRQPVNALEYAKFTRWRSQPLIAESNRPLRLLGAPTNAVTGAFSSSRFWLVPYVALTAMILLSWLWPNGTR
jgi:type IV secretion system protein VirD4